MDMFSAMLNLHTRLDTNLLVQQTVAKWQLILMQKIQFFNFHFPVQVSTTTISSKVFYISMVTFQTTI